MLCYVIRLFVKHLSQKAIQMNVATFDMHNCIYLINIYIVTRSQLMPVCIYLGKFFVSNYLLTFIIAS